MIRVYLLDDHEVVRRGLRELLEVEDDIEVVGESAQRPARPPDASLPSARTSWSSTPGCPDGSGIDVCRDVRSVDPSVAGHRARRPSTTTRPCASAVLAGAAGYLLKDIRGSRLVDSIRRVARARACSTTRWCRGCAPSGATTSTTRGSTELSPQERRILQHIAEGLTNRQIGEALALAEKTVKNYVTSVLAKIGMERRTQAAVYMARQGAAALASGPALTGTKGPVAGCARSRHARRTSPFAAQEDP